MKRLTITSSTELQRTLVSDYDTILSLKSCSLFNKKEQDTCSTSQKTNSLHQNGDIRRVKAATVLVNVPPNGMDSKFIGGTNRDITST